MKNLSLLLVFVTVVFFTFTGCKKDEGGDENPSGSGTMTLKYDGADWSASLAVVATNQGGIIAVTGSDSNARQANVTIMGSTTGTYEIVMGGPHNARWTESLDPADTYVANGVIGSGTITITTVTATDVAGTFMFVGMNTDQSTKNITEGSFNAEFQ